MLDFLIISPGWSLTVFNVNAQLISMQISPHFINSSNGFSSIYNMQIAMN